MNAALDMVVGMTRSWVAVYTSGLAPELRDARRAEIDSDLWEHQRTARLQDQPPGETALQLLTRLLLGILSDVTWRLETGHSVSGERSIRMNEALYMRGLVAVGVALALLVVIVGVGSIFNAFEDGDNSGWVWGGSLSALSGVAVMVGLLISRPNPLLGIGLVAAGAITIAVLWHWLLVITIPIGIALVTIAFFRARQTGWPRGAGTA